jgi:8-oxo-dGTP pyrophosphatase MutT (NUDIX family)
MRENPGGKKNTGDMKMTRQPDIDTIRSAIKGGDHPGPPTPGRYDATSVMALFFFEQQIKLLFIQKAPGNGYTWANQMAFPGGHWDKTDPSSKHTALRELQEELGIDAKNVNIIGSLGHFQTLNNKDIEAWTGIWNIKDRIDCDSNEVARVFKIPLNHLIAVHEKNKYHCYEPDVDQLIYPWEDVRIWGATARILWHLLNLIIEKTDHSSSA